MANYASGRYFEWLVKKDYEKQGAIVVRSTGSRGLIDLVVIWKGNRKPLLIQAKIFSGTTVPKPSQEFKDLKAGGFIKLWVAKRKGKNGSKYTYEVD